MSRAASHSPRLSYGRHAGPARCDARPAAVLVLLYPHDHRWHLALTERQRHLAAHAGQVSLPGGALENGEPSLCGALRETHEELGVASDHWKIVGKLANIYVFNSNFLVTPWLALADERPDFIPNSEEVASLVELPVAHLVHAERSTFHICRGPLAFSAPSLSWKSHVIWGATWVILGDLLDLLQEAQLPIDS